MSHAQMRAERLALLRWTARMGAVTAEACGVHAGCSVPSARSRLNAATRAGLLSRKRPLVDQPALYTITGTGRRATGVREPDPCRVTAANALHLIVCAEVAAALERSYPDHRVLGERELRRGEQEIGAAIASASMNATPRGRSPLHRPDLVLCPPAGARELPVAVEVELTIKAPRRLADICRAWARCRCVAGVLYLAAPDVEQALARAIERAHAGERIAVVPLDALAHRGAAPRTPAERTVPGGS